MKNIIYSKYSNERAEQFKIRTDILEDSEGRKVVQKIALTSEADTHINNIYKYYFILSELYKESKISINKCKKIDKGLEFEYIIGKTLEEELDELISRNDYVKVIEKIREYVSIIEKGIGSKTFKQSDDFIKVFGEVNLPSYLRAGDVNNIDLLFNNIIIGEKWNIIDYEWTFNFSVPFNYIIYRAIRIYIGSSSKANELINLGIYKQFGITDNETIQYDRMERKFQAYVLEGWVDLWKLYGETTEKNINIQQVMELQQMNAFKNTVQVFYDYGQGYSEKNSYKIIPSLDKSGEIVLEVPILPNVKQIRIDPANDNSVVSIKSIIGYTTEYYSINYITNGIKLNEGTILFATNDPQILITDIKAETAKLELKFEVQVVSKEIAIELYKVIQDKEAELKDKEDQTQDKENQIQGKDKEIKDKDEEIKDKDKKIKDKDKEIKDKDKKIKDKDEEIKDKDKEVKDKEKEIEEKEKKIQNKENEIQNKEKKIQDKEKEIDNYKLKYDVVIAQREDLNTRLLHIETAYNIILNSTSWKFTKPLRVFFDLLKKGKNNIYGIADLESSNYLYNIDSFSYENNVLKIDGWIFNVNKTINNVTLLLVNGKKEYRVAILNGLERMDVYNAYKNENSLYSGFSCKIRIENVRNLFIYLEIDGDERILVNKIKGSLSEQLKHYKKKLNNNNIKKVLMLIKKNQLLTLKEAAKKLVIEEIDDNFNSINFIEFQKSNIIDSISYPEALYRHTIDIIVPVYNGYEYLKKLFDTISKTKMDYRLIIVNDKSTDVRVGEFLKQYAINKKTILIENESNLGFIKTVNKAFNIANNHIALLNTDIELPEMWLERLMIPIISDKNIASSTPFTNSGTICSFPNFCKDNVIFERFNVDTIDEQFKLIKPNYTNIPTGVGFCMGINKNILDEIGVFDADTFSKGYCEENDWCQRAIKAGYKNVHVENLYVYHKHGGSFLSEEKKKLVEKNIALLLKKHPNYNVDVAQFCSIDPVKNIRNYIVFKLLCKKSEGILVYFDHNIGGGATSYLKNAVNGNISKNENVIIVRYDISIRGYILDYKYKQYNLSYYCTRFDDIMSILKELKIKNIYINELVTYPNLYDVLEKLEELKNEKNINMTMLLHDFFAICPTINLLDDKGCYCDIPNIEKCEQCLKNNELNNYLSYESIIKWRGKWRQFLDKCTEIIAFSENSKVILQKSYDLITQISVVPHTVNYMNPLNKQYKYTNTLNIGLLGTLNHHKGFDIIKEMLDVIEKSNLDVNIVLIGSTVETISHKNFKQTGAYTTDMIPKLVFENDIDLFFISSIWPETFSYTTQEVITMELPIVSFDIGAPAERIKEYNKGMVLNSFNVQSALNKIIEFQKGFSYKTLLINKKVLFIGEYISFSSRYRVEHFREQLLINGIKSDFILFEDIKRHNVKEYETVVIYRCGFNDKIDRFIKECHENNMKVFYDIDDYIFDYDKIKELDFLNGEDYHDFDKYSLNIFKCMECCDGFITSTENMKNAIKAAFENKPVCVNRNVASMEMLTISLKAKNEVIKDKDKVVIGYFSGSKTHDKDFEIISNTLLEILRNNKKVYLKIGGCLNLSKEFQEFEDRIEFSEFVDWKKLPYLIASVDINLLPVEDTFFHSCKSENKWTEAALVGVPTIASYNTELERVTISGYDGVLCKTTKEWKEHLNQLINDYSYRIMIGQESHNVVLDKYITSTSGIEAIEFITSNF